MNDLAFVSDSAMNARRREPPLPPEDEDAIHWSIRLSSDAATDDDRAAFKEWITRSTANEAAWLRLAASLNAFAVAGRRQRRPGGFADRILRHRRSRRAVLRNVLGLGLVGASAASVANRFVPLRDLFADRLTRTGQVERVSLADGGSVVLGPRTGVNIGRADNVRTVSLLEGEVLVDASREALFLSTRDMSLSAERGSFVGRRRGDVSLMFAVDTQAIVSCNGMTTPLKPGHVISFDGTSVETRPAAARTQTGWVEGKLFVENETLGAVVDRLRPYFVGIIRVDPVVTRLSVTGLFPLDDLDLAFATLARALDLSVRHISPLWVTIGPIATPI